MNNEEQQYLELLRNIMENGDERSDRTGVGTKAIFGTQLRFSLENNTLPLLTTKKVFFKGVVEELLFFIRGETDTKKLEAKGVNIWKGNTSREFLDSRGLTYLDEGDMGKGYGYQWRKFNGHEGWLTLRDYPNAGIDQLKNVFNSLKFDPFSRRHIITAWNPEQLQEMSLPPCHYAMQFFVNSKKELSCQWIQRSIDGFLGLPFNIASYSLLTHIIAKATGLKAKEVIFSGGDSHVYNNHIEQIKIQLTREPFDFPKLNINKSITSVEDMEKLSFEDFEVINYKCHSPIKAVMAI